MEDLGPVHKSAPTLLDHFHAVAIKVTHCLDTTVLVRIRMGTEMQIHSISISH